VAKPTVRAKCIYEAGLPAYGGEPPPSAQKMMKAIALMLAEATKPKKKKAATKNEGATLAFGPGELYEACLARVPHIIACEPYDQRWFGRLGKVLQASKGLTADDLETLVAWIEGGALDFGSNWSFSHVIKHFPNWMAQARQGGSGQQAGQGPEGYME